jgi:hypothetical protein
MRTSNRLFFGLFFVIGVLAIGYGASLLVQSLRCEYWPVTDGVIETAVMKYQANSHSGHHGGTYGVKITYHYQVAGTGLEGTQVAFGELESSAAHAQAILDRYPPGQKVQVHYDAANPQRAVLEPGIHGGTWLYFTLGAMFALVGGWQLGLYRRLAF